MSQLRRIVWPNVAIISLVGAGFITSFATGQNSICATVKIEINQQLDFDRQAFDAHMRINNPLNGISLEHVAINLEFADEYGQGVPASSNQSDKEALFFISVESLEGIDDVRGQGVVQSNSHADIHWLIIPTQRATGTQPSGTMYLVGATLRYTLRGEEKRVKVSPDYIFVKPLPRLTLDYFMPAEVYADDALTDDVIEAPVPFHLGVRVKNTGGAAAAKLKIESAQPEIVDNEQGLMIGFKILGSSVNGLRTNDGLLADFGEVAAQGTGVGRWVMTTTLSGRFVGFSATYSHADELGGELTSILEKTNTHLLIHDVLVDFSGRDDIRDFLAKDGDTLHVYESHGLDRPVTDQSNETRLQSRDRFSCRITSPATDGAFFVKLPDPFNGEKAIIGAVRSDGKQLPTTNSWLSKTRNEDDSWEHFINLFDVNTKGNYTLTFKEKPVDDAVRLQFIADRQTREGEQVSFLVETNTKGNVPVLTAVGLPQGAVLTDDRKGKGVFDWTPGAKQAGSYPIRFVASAGDVEVSQMATITVIPNQDMTPAWVAGAVPAGGRLVGDWNWHDEPSLSPGVRSHAGKPDQYASLHYFTRAETTLNLDDGDNVVQYVYLDPEDPPEQFALQLFVDGQHAGNRAYWGNDILDSGGAKLVRLGDLPEPGKWIRLSIPVAKLEMKNAEVNGMLYDYAGGKVFWGPTTKDIFQPD